MVMVVIDPFQDTSSDHLKGRLAKQIKCNMVAFKTNRVVFATALH
jgi:hypothetical protein